MPAVHGKATAQRFNVLIRQTKSGKRRSFAIGHAGPKGLLLVSARKPTVAEAVLKTMTYPKKDNTKDPLPDGAKPEPLACGEVVLDGQEVLLKCVKMKSASS